MELGSNKTGGKEKGTRGRHQGTESQDRTPLAVLKSCAVQLVSLPIYHKVGSTPF